MPGWNIADVFEVVAAAVPASPALIQGGRVLSWRELDRRAGQVAAYLAAQGLVRQDKVVQYLRNCPEYLESFAAALKASMVPVNTNYRYGPEELSYLWRDCDARAVVFAGSFTATIERTRDSVPGVRGLALGGRRDRALPAVGGAVRVGRRARHPAVRSRAGSGTATTSSCSTPGAPPGCPRG